MTLTLTYTILPPIYPYPLHSPFSLLPLPHPLSPPAFAHGQALAAASETSLRKEPHVREHHRAVRGEVAGPTRRMRALRFTPGYLSFPASAVGMDSHGYSAIFFLSGVGGFNVGCVCELFILRIVCFCLCARVGFAAPVSFFVWDF